LSTNIVSGGVAVHINAALTVGTHSITARYLGQGIYLASTSSVLSQFVQSPQATSTLLTSAPNPSLTGGNVSFNATVRVGGMTASNATGLVIFKDNTVALSTNTVSGGVAVFNTSALAVGSHPLNAEYLGDPLHLANTSAPMAQVVLAIPTTPTNLTWSAAGGQLTLSWPGYLGWVLQVQTNALKDGLGANWLDLPGTASLTETNVNFNAAEGCFYRLRYP
jgi:hypothetical protein